MAFDYAKPVSSEPQVRSEIGAAVTYVVSGNAATVADTLFNRTPPNGTVVVGADGLAVRVGGVWETVTYDA